MQGLDPVCWIYSHSDWQKILLIAMRGAHSKVESTRQWQQRITLHPLEDANGRIWEVLAEILK